MTSITPKEGSHVTKPSAIRGLNQLNATPMHQVSSSTQMLPMGLSNDATVVASTALETQSKKHLADKLE